ncbi:MAG: CapA family protein [Candidatus Levybacteria bacterium]|nr:CapA family protein [Candidatus Levybacteria bacterium]
MKPKPLLIILFFAIYFLISNIFFYTRFHNPQKRTLKINFVNNQIKISESGEFLPQNLTLQEIFQENHGWVASLAAQNTITMIATGDVIPARSVNFKTVTINNFRWPYEKTFEVLKSADLTFINLESPLIDNCPLTNEGMVFCGDKRNVGGLIFAGVDVANLANNHSSNYGEQGLSSTVDLLSKFGILSSGTGPISYTRIKNTRFAFLGYNALDFQQSNLKINKTRIKSDITKARKNADIIVVAFHWGEEYTPQPNKVQRELAHLAIDSGADLIIGNHPHWIQPVEIYRNKLIMYAHGNFVFDQMWSEITKEGVIGRYTFFDKKLIDVEFLPIKIESYGQPYFLEGKEKEDILKSLFEESKSISR